MTEADWLTSTDPDAMLSFLRGNGKLTERKARLFAVGCCRHIWHLLADERLRDAVAVSEAHADGNVGDEALSAAYAAALDAYRTVHEHLTGHPPAEIVSATVTDESGRTGVAAWLSDHPPVEALAEVPSPQAAALSATEAVLRAASPARLLPWTACQLAADAAAGRYWKTSNPRVGPVAKQDERVAQAVLLRDIFGSLPFRSLPPLPPCVGMWNDGCVVKLATTIYQERSLPAGTLDPHRLAVLADALQEAGCDDVSLIEHLRGPGPHHRGCHAVDAVLLRE